MNKNPDEKFRQGFIGTRATEQQSKRKEQASLLASGGGASRSVKCGEGRGRSEGLPAPLWRYCVQGSCVVLFVILLLLPAGRHLKGGRWLWAFHILLFIICPNCPCMELFLVS